MGGFVYTGEAIPFTDIGTRGMRYTGPVGAEVQGWLRVKEAGRYQVAVDLSAHLGSASSPPTYFFQAWLEAQPRSMHRPCQPAFLKRAGCHPYPCSGSRATARPLSPVRLDRLH